MKKKHHSKRVTARKNSAPSSNMMWQLHITKFLNSELKKTRNHVDTGLSVENHQFWQVAIIYEKLRSSSSSKNHQSNGQ